MYSSAVKLVPRFGMPWWNNTAATAFNSTKTLPYFLPCHPQHQPLFVPPVPFIPPVPSIPSVPFVPSVPFIPPVPSVPSVHNYYLSPFDAGMWTDSNVVGDIDSIDTIGSSYGPWYRPEYKPEYRPEYLPEYKYKTDLLDGYRGDISVDKFDIKNRLRDDIDDEVDINDIYRTKTLDDIYRSKLFALKYGVDPSVYSKYTTPFSPFSPFEQSVYHPYHGIVPYGHNPLIPSLLRKEPFEIDNELSRQLESESMLSSVGIDIEFAIKHLDRYLSIIHKKRINKLTRHDALLLLGCLKKVFDVTISDVAKFINRTEIWTKMAFIGRQHLTKYEAELLLNIFRVKGINKKICDAIVILLTTHTPLSGASLPVFLDPTFSDIKFQEYPSTIKEMKEKMGIYDDISPIDTILYKLIKDRDIKTDRFINPYVNPYVSPYVSPYTKW